MKIAHLSSEMTHIRTTNNMAKLKENYSVQLSIINNLNTTQIVALESLQFQKLKLDDYKLKKLLYEVENKSLMSDLEISRKSRQCAEASCDLLVVVVLIFTSFLIRFVDDE
jgi:hypothetical protein